jgi:hypothetical protein
VLKGDFAVLREWRSIPQRLRRAVGGLSAAGLSARGGSEGWSIREYVHHLVESNLVAGTIVLAAVGRPGARYDWSWLVPDAAWMRRLRYRRLPVEPALGVLEALTAHVAALARSCPRAHVRLVGTSGRMKRTTVTTLLREECAHAKHHLADIRAISTDKP